MGKGACTEMPASAETPEPLVTPLSDAASPPGSMEEYFFDCRGYTVLSSERCTPPLSGGPTCTLADAPSMRLVWAAQTRSRRPSSSR